MNGDIERLTASRRDAERRRTLSIRITMTPDQWRRLQALGFEPGDDSPINWMLAEIEGARADLEALRNDQHLRAYREQQHAENP